MTPTLKEARRLMALALDFWSAPDIDMPDFDTFDGMVRFVGREWESKWSEDGRYLGQDMKPTGMSWEEFRRREYGRQVLAPGHRPRARRRQVSGDHGTR